MDSTTLELVNGVLERQVELNNGVLRALEALTLQADRYDSELAELRDEILTLSRRLDSAQTAGGVPINYCRSCGRPMGTSVYRGKQYPVCRNPQCEHADVLVTMHSVRVPEEVVEP